MELLSTLRGREVKLSLSLWVLVKLSKVRSLASHHKIILIDQPEPLSYLTISPSLPLFATIQYLVDSITIIMYLEPFTASFKIIRMGCCKSHPFTVPGYLVRSAC
jgi:hypothetical protein